MQLFTSPAPPRDLALHMGAVAMPRSMDVTELFMEAFISMPLNSGVKY